jgi:hypothetical protein
MATSPQEKKYTMPRASIIPGSLSRPGRKRGALTEGVNCLSWDCGTTNLCYCLLEYLGGPEKEFRVVMWENFSLNAQSIKHAVEMLPRELDRRPWMLDVDYVCIESQVVQNIEMKVVSHALQMYFVTRSLVPPVIQGIAPPSSSSSASSVTMTTAARKPISVHFISAKSKFTVCDVEEPNLKTRRARNKRVAVLMAQKLLQEQGDEQTLRYLNKHTKKDDLADSLIQAVYFLRIVYNRSTQTKKVLKHLGLETTDDTEGVVIDINEGREVHTEVPLPQVYKSETFTRPVYAVPHVEPSNCYSRTPPTGQWAPV